jgi:hypothetical protein
MAKAAYPTIGIAAFVMFVIVYFIDAYSSDAYIFALFRVDNLKKS